MIEMALADLVPLWRTIRDQGVTALITPAMDYSGAVEIYPVDARFSSEDELSSIGEGLRRLVGSLEDACVLHFIHRVTDRPPPSIHNYENRAGLARNGPYHSYVEDRARWLSRQHLRTSRTFMFFSCSPTGPGPLNRGILGSKLLFGDPSRQVMKQHAERLSDLAQLRSKLTGRLAALGVGSRELSPAEIHELHYGLLNPTRTLAGCKPPEVILRDNLWSEKAINIHGNHLREYTEAEQLVFEEIEEHRDYFLQGQVFRRIATLKLLPEDGTGYFSSAPLLALAVNGEDGSPRPFSYTLGVTVVVEAQGKARLLLNAQHGLVSVLKNAIPFLANSSADKDAADNAKQKSIASLFAELSEMSSKLVTLSISVLLEAKTLEQLNAHTEAARSAFNQAGNSDLLLETVGQVPAFLSLLPGSGAYQVRRKTCTSRNAADFLPVFGPWRGSSKPTSLFPSPDGDLLQLDFFDKELAQVHHLLGVADSGAGKSMGTGALLIDALASGVDAILVDNGNSWRRLTQLFGGIHIPVDLKTSLSPFMSFAQVADPDGSLNNEVVQQIVRFIEVCVADETLRGFDKPAADLVGRAVRRCYIERFRERAAARPLISDFRDFIQTHPSEHPDDRRISELLVRRLGMFCDGVYADFLNRPSMLRLDAKLLTFDLAGVSKDPILKPIAVAALMEAVGARASKRTNRTIVAIDEAHEFLADEVAARYLAGWYRKMRKFDVAMWSLTQRFSDFLSCPVGPAIEGNAGIKFFLRHGSGHDLISSYFKFSKRTDAAFRKLTFKAGYFSDLLLLYGQRTTTVRLALHPLAYWILTTDPEDTDLLVRAANKNPGLDLFAILRELAVLYPHGAPRGRREAA